GLTAAASFLVRTSWAKFHSNAANTGFNAFENVIGTSNVSQLSASGTTNCSGTPKTCKPLWTGRTGFLIDGSSPVVAGGVVYVASEEDKLYAFSAAGTTGCSRRPEDLQAPVDGRDRRLHRLPAVAGALVD